MQGIIRIGDKTTHGGAVQSGSSAMIFCGIGVARKGDKVSCHNKGMGQPLSQKVIRTTWIMGSRWRFTVINAPAAARCSVLYPTRW